MSGTNLSSDGIEKWLEEETRSILTPVQTQARQLRDEMNAAIQSEIEVSKMLLDNSTKEIERRNMRVYNRARALSKLAHLFLERLRKLSIPEQVTYDSLNKLAQDTQKVFMVADIDVKNWFPRVSPFFIMDRRKFLTVHEKAKITLTSVNEFLAKEYVKTKTLEETFEMIKALHTQEEQTENIKTQLANMEKERFPLEQKITELETQISALKSKGPIDQLKLAECEVENLNNELKHQLRYLQKPFLKTQALSYQGGGSGLTEDELKRLAGYLKEPLETLANEETGYPRLKELVSKLSRLIKENKIKLKPEKARKAEQAMEDILNRDSLAYIHIRIKDVVSHKTKLLSSGKMNEIMHDIAISEEQLVQLKARQASAVTHEAIIERALTDTQEKVRNNKQTIEKNVHNSLGKQIQII